MLYQYNKLTKKSKEVILPLNSDLRDQEWADKFNESGSLNNYYSTQNIIEENDVTNEEMDAFFEKSLNENFIRHLG